MNVLGIYHPEPEWFQARLGLITSSKINDAITLRQKGGTHDLAARRKLKFQLISEMTTGQTPEHYVSAAMDWGIENEPRARAEYEYRTGCNVEQLGLVMHPTNPRAAATADGWVAPNGILEIKCPETHTHYEYRAENAIPKEYLDQIDWQMACCGPEIEWCDFVSYDPRIEDEELQMLIIRHERDPKRQAEMEEGVTQFFTETLQLFEQIKRGRPSLATQLERSLEARKAFRKMENDALMEQLRDEGIQVP